MNWKIFGVLLVGVGLLAACGGAEQSPAATPMGNRQDQVDQGGFVTKDEPQPPKEEKKPAPTNEAVMHD